MSRSNLNPARRRLLTGGIAALALAGSSRALAQAALPRVVVVIGVDALAEAFAAGLRDQGRVDGKNVRLEHLKVLSDDETTPGRIEQMLRSEPAVAVLSGAFNIAIAVKLARRTPLVGTDLETDPVAAGLAKSLARPGGNLTGVYLDLPELAGKNVQLLRELVPGLTSLGAIWDERIGSAQFNALQAAARATKLRLHSGAVRSPSEAEAAVERVIKAGAEALVVLTAPGLLLQRERISGLALRHKVPVASLLTAYPEGGALVAYGPSLPLILRQAAGHVDRILRGAKPGEIPIERPVKFELVINAVTAKKLGIAIPESVRLRADRVIDV